MICKQCGAPIGEGERICSYCRAAVEIERPMQEPVQNTVHRNRSNRSTRRTVVINGSKQAANSNAFDSVYDIFEEAFAEQQHHTTTQSNRTVQSSQVNHVAKDVFYSPTGKPAKDKVSAGILAILLGGIGVHKFYLGKIGPGILYLFLCWTLIPAIIGVIEGIYYLAVSDEKWVQKVGYKQ